MAICMLAVFGSAHCSNWQAKVIAARGKAPLTYIEDYAKRVRHDAWDFEEGDDEGIHFVSGLRKHLIDKGKLSFLTAGSTEFGWGDIDGRHPASGEESICHTWKEEWYPWVVRITLAQSLRTSAWYVKAAYKRNGLRKVKRQDVQVDGKGQQTVIVNMGSCRHDVVALYIGTTSAGNHVTIESVEVMRPSLKQYLVREFDIEDRQLISKLVIGSSGHFRLFLNGNMILDRGVRSPYQYRLNQLIDESSLKKGKNLIAVEQEMINWHYSGKQVHSHFFMESRHYDLGGKVYSINSDESWRGSYQEQKDWYRTTGASRDWYKVEVSGSLRYRSLDGTLKEDWGDYLDVPYMGRIKMSIDGRSRPIVTAETETSISLHVIGITNAKANRIQYGLYNAGGEKVRSGQLGLVGGPDLHGSFVISGLSSGTFTIRFSYFNGSDLVEESDHELVVAGKIHQTTVAMGSSLLTGLGSKLVFSKRITRKDMYDLDYGWAGRKNPGRKSAVVPSFRDARTGAYIDTGAARGAWLAVRYKLQNVGKPHILRVVSSGRGAQNVIYSIVERSAYRRLENIGPVGAVSRASVGMVFDEKKTVDSPSESQFVFWPGAEEGEVVVVKNGAASTPSPSVSALEIYELDDLPDIGQGVTASSPLVGPFVERIDRTSPRYFYSGPRGDKFVYNLNDTRYAWFYSDWYLCIENLIKYLKFTGQNTYFAGVYMYYGASFPSAEFQGHAESGLDYHGSGWNTDAIPLMARMFEQNNLRLVLGVQFMGSRMLNSLAPVSDYDMRQGKPTSRLVSKNGEQVIGLQGEGFNYNDPVVQQEIYRLTREIAERYKEYPAIKGLTWMRVPEYRVAKKDSKALMPRDIGYGDITIARFEQDTGIQVPIAENDPQRFLKRYNWLMTHEEYEWQRWRSASVYGVDSRIYAILTQYRPDWRLWRLSNRPTALEYRSYLDHKIGYWDIYKWQGPDPDLYDNREGPEFVAINDITTEYLYDIRGYDREYITAIRKWNKDGAVANKKINGLFVRTAFSFENKIRSAKHGNWENATIITTSAPSNWDTLQRRLDDLNIGAKPVFPIGWSDGGHFAGHETEIRKTVKKIYSLWNVDKSYENSN